MKTIFFSLWLSLLAVIFGSYELNATSQGQVNDQGVKRSTRRRVDINRLCDQLTSFTPTICSFDFVRKQCKHTCCTKKGKKLIPTSDTLRHYEFEIYWQLFPESDMINAGLRNKCECLEYKKN